MRHSLSHFRLIVTAAFVLLTLLSCGIVYAADEGRGVLTATDYSPTLPRPDSEPEARQGESFPVRPTTLVSTAKDFTLKGLDGEEVTLSTLRGRVVLLSFWATWCVPCKVEFPALQRLSEEFKGRGLTVVAIAADTKGRVEGFIEEYGSGDMTIVLDRYGSVMRDYSVRLFPMGVIIGADGRLIGTMTGARDYSGEAAFAYFEELLEQERLQE
ncbi:MAG: TlpA family protein disulfide reductase [Deltaproteobacteria bacterium]|nr:TlpA family protein disulfide reductase [Deltaproteobacteria bacterium]